MFYKGISFVGTFQRNKLFEGYKSLLEVHAVSFTASLLLLPVLKTPKLIMLTDSYYGKKKHL